MPQSGPPGNFCTALGVVGLLLTAPVGGASRFLVTPYEFRTEFLYASPAGTSTGLYGYVNPALLAYVEAAETVIAWSDEGEARRPVNDWGVFSAIPHVGFGVIHRRLEGTSFADYRLSVAAGDRNASLGLGYGWSRGGDPDVRPGRAFVLGGLLRPSPRFSLGLTGTVSPTFSAREGAVDLALRPGGTDRLTLFADGVLASDRAGDSAFWSAGGALTLWPGFQLIGRYIDSRTLGIGVNVDLGHLGIQTHSRYDRHRGARRDRTRNLYALRLGGARRADGLSFAKPARRAYVDLSLTGRLTDRSYALFDVSTTLIELLTLIGRAERDPLVDGLAIDLSGMRLSHEKIWELRRRLEKFQQSGRHVVVYLDRASLRGYHLASVADRIVMDPVGLLALEGFVAGATYVKGALDRIGIGAEEWRFQKYKSAGEQLVRTGMSPADREQWQTLLDDAYALTRDDITRSRGMTSAEFDHLVDDVTLFLPADALEHDLVDTLARWDAVGEVIASLEGGERRRLSPSSLSPGSDDRWSEVPRIAVVYALGMCAMDTGIRARSLVGDIRRLAEDDLIRAVVVRVDSPGGDVLPSDLVAVELQKLRKKKPVIVSQGSVAASGGYWISMNSDAIVAAPNTVTGSIGVFGGWIFDRGFKESLGVTTDRVQVGRHADLGFGMSLPFTGLTLPDRNLNEVEKRRMERAIRILYRQFVDKVALARGSTPAAIDSVAQGRVWSGQRARDVGLIDELGGLDRAIDLARQKAGLDPDEPVRIVERPRMTWFRPIALRGLLLPRFAAGYDRQRGGSSAALEEFRFRLEHNGQPLLMLPMEWMGVYPVDP